MVFYCSGLYVCESPLLLYNIADTSKVICFYMMILDLIRELWSAGYDF
jgi:hypothetical protein